ncbi:cysteine proteinase [Corynespora cassiicola Philippines]|uniref:Cysteine proteinase n=1 Tax=Corynespora cassiicola Philippines TaxID=1448308 RepID=A0A2T2NR15_CORCC|nr:cysteine proteinase [Corynespora cassiicola Philippines]
MSYIHARYLPTGVFHLFPALCRDFFVLLTLCPILFHMAFVWLKKVRTFGGDIAPHPPLLRRANFPLRPTRSNKGDRQKGHDSRSGHIRNEWPIKRGNVRPRGLENGGNYCFRNAALQALLHLPKFINFVLTHNEVDARGIVSWPCNSNDPNLDTSQSGEDELSNEDQLVCVACAMKHLIQEYWGDERVNKNKPYGDGKPGHLPNGEGSLLPIHRLAQRWYTPRPNPDLTDDERIKERDNRQDSEDFLRRILDGIDSSINRNCFPRIGQKFDSLFLLTKNETRTYTPLQCEKCGSAQLHTSNWRIDAAPEYLVVSLNLRLGDTNVKDTAPVSIPEVLNVTELHARPTTPFKYEILNVVYHAGSLNGGHYKATVTGVDGRVFEVNDKNVSKVDRKQLTKNPLGVFNTYYMIYMRVTNR